MSGTAGAPGGPLPETPPAGLCPSCRGRRLRFVLEQTAPVHTSVLLDSRDAAIAYPRGPVRLELCEDCGLLTNTAFDAPGHDYSASYEETQAFSPRFRAYATELAAALVQRHGLAGADVLEIGCGRADFLLLLCEASGGRGVGVDPSWRDEQLAGPAAGGIHVARDFFEPRHVDRPFGLVACRHTLEHVHDVHGFLATLRSALAPYPGTTVFFEVPDTGRVLRETAFWDVYYEHCSYFTPGSLARAFRCAGFGVTDLALGFDRQYVQLTARPDGAGGETPPLEEPASDVAAAADRFAREVAAARARWRDRLGSLRAQGRTCVVWGAGSKAVGFLATLGLDAEIACAVDVNPAKHGMYLPGTGHEIVSPARLPDVRPDVVVVMNPAYADEIRRELAALGVDAAVETL